MLITKNMAADAQSTQAAASAAAGPGKTDPRNLGHRWKKGAPSPNPNGRPPGVPALATALREAVTERKDEIVKALLDKAAEGDTNALRLIAERFAPAMKATYAPTAIPGLQEATNLRERIHAVQDAMSCGILSADHAATVIASLKDSEVALQVEAMREELAALRAQLVIDVQP